TSGRSYVGRRRGCSSRTVENSEGGGLKWRNGRRNRYISPFEWIVERVFQQKFFPPRQRQLRERGWNAVVALISEGDAVGCQSQRLRTGPSDEVQRQGYRPPLGITEIHGHSGAPHTSRHRLKGCVEPAHTAGRDGHRAFEPQAEIIWRRS